jgi:hypothetical protein
MIVFMFVDIIWHIEQTSIIDSSLVINLRIYNSIESFQNWFLRGFSVLFKVFFKWVFNVVVNVLYKTVCYYKDPY